MPHRYPLALLLGLALTAGCAAKNPAPPPNNEPVPAATERAEGQVCCERFGYGAMMVKCCESYEWTAPEVCVAEPDLAGGSVGVVEDEKCGG